MNPGANIWGSYGYEGRSVPSQATDELSDDEILALWRAGKLRVVLGENSNYGPGNPDWEHDRQREGE